MFSYNKGCFVFDHDQFIICPPQYKHADKAANDIATLVTNFKSLKLQEIKQFGITLVATSTVTQL